MKFRCLPRSSCIAVLSAVAMLGIAESGRADCSLSVTIVPSHDAFARELDPGLNYGSGGALHVAGVDAVNSLGESNGRHDTLMKVDPTAALAGFDAAFGAGNWTLVAAELVTQEVGLPNNPIFNVGAGQFKVQWLSDDSWIQGPGTPQFPTAATGNEMCWNLLQTILGSATETHMGTYANESTSGQRNYSLTLVPEFVSDVLSGGPVSLHLTAETPTIGYTFFASNHGISTNHPQLVLTARATGGDVNCDAVRNLADVDAFVLAVLDPAAFTTTYPGCAIAGADLNHDGNVDGLDISALLCALVP